MSREFFVTAGHISIGRFVVEDKTGTAKAFDAADKPLGKFPNYHAARKAVSQAHDDAEAREASAAAARKRLEEPAAFESGLPADFLGGKRR